jgi:hypothetical protein
MEAFIQFVRGEMSRNLPASGAQHSRNSIMRAAPRHTIGVVK